MHVHSFILFMYITFIHVAFMYIALSSYTSQAFHQHTDVCIRLLERILFIYISFYSYTSHSYTSHSYTSLSIHIHSIHIHLFLFIYIAFIRFTHVRCIGKLGSTTTLYIRKRATRQEMSLALTRKDHTAAVAFLNKEEREFDLVSGELRSRSCLPSYNILAHVKVSFLTAALASLNKADCEFNIVSGELRSHSCQPSEVNLV